jgi:hypothetical protein
VSHVSTLADVGVTVSTPDSTGGLESVGALASIPASKCGAPESPGVDPPLEELQAPPSTVAMVARPRGPAKGIVRARMDRCIETSRKDAGGG